MPGRDSKLLLLAHATRRSTIFATIHPPRLYLEPSRTTESTDSGPPTLRSLTDEDAGQLVCGDPEWTCADALSGVTYLVDAWCERRYLAPLRLLLPAWPPNGLTDDAQRLLAALRFARATTRDGATDFEWELLSVVESTLSARL